MREFVVCKTEYRGKCLILAASVADGRIEELEAEPYSGFQGAETEGAYAGRSEVGRILAGVTESKIEGLGGAFVRGGKRLYYLPRRKHENLAVSQPLVFQVVKDADGEKAAEITENLELAGEYAVISRFPGKMSFSRKLTEEQKHLIRKWIPEELPEHYRILIRTNACRAEKAQLVSEIERLENQMNEILARFPGSKSGDCLFAPEPFYVRMYRSLYAKPDRCVTDLPRVREELERAGGSFRNTPDLCDTLDSQYGLTREMDLLLEKKVLLPDGAYLIIEETAAFVSIDVNSGRSRKGKKAENAFYLVNLAAADEIARQIRLRNLSGMILTDFISMEDEQHRRDLLTHMRKLVRKDHVLTEAVDITPLGIMEIVREKQRRSLHSIVFS